MRLYTQRGGLIKARMLVQRSPLPVSLQKRQGSNILLPTLLMLGK